MTPPPSQPPPPQIFLTIFPIFCFSSPCPAPDSFLFLSSRAVGSKKKQSHFTPHGLYLSACLVSSSSFYFDRPLRTDPLTPSAHSSPPLPSSLPHPFPHIKAGLTPDRPAENENDRRGPRDNGGTGAHAGGFHALPGLHIGTTVNRPHVKPHPRLLSKTHTHRHIPTYRSIHPCIYAVLPLKPEHTAYDAPGKANCGSVPEQSTTRGTQNGEL